VFNGSRFRAEIAPRIADFVLSNNANSPHKKAPAAGARSANGASHGANGVAPNGAAKPLPRPAV
jgi:poly(3-hydroxybutyrate) depolymerase